MIDLKTLRNKQVEFVALRDDALWYRVVEDNFDFPVPLSETRGGVWLAQDRAMPFLRWIKRWQDLLEDELARARTP